MRIERAKRHDHQGVLTCYREDGTTSWQKQSRHAAYLAHHDLTHFTVETTLGYEKGFFWADRRGVGD